MKERRKCDGGGARLDFHYMLPLALCLTFLVTWMEAQSTCTSPDCTIQKYYIAINEVEWDYAPSQMDKWSGVPIDKSTEASKFLQPSANRIGRVYKKVMYVGYKDAEFKQPLEREPWLGLLGPILRIEAGDELHVTLFNNATRPYSFYPHALTYAPPTTDDLLRKGIPAGQKDTLVFKAPSNLAQGSTPTFWLYHSHVDEVKDVYSGLFGGLVVYPRGMAQPPREFVNVFIVIDEGLSWYIGDNKKKLATPPKEDADWVEANQKHSLNGYLFANVEGMKMQLGERVWWYVGSLGGEKDLHTAHWHGASLLHQGHRVDVADLLPGETQVLEMTPDVPGKWLYHCHVNDHVVSGMSAMYEVVDKGLVTTLKSGGTGTFVSPLLLLLVLFLHVFHQ